MIAEGLMVASSAVVFVLGAIHLIYTFFGPKLSLRDPALREGMDKTSPVITKQTTMWRAWVGFNASHSMGAILFSLIYGFLAVEHSEMLFSSPFLLVIGAAMLGGYLFLGRLYWFKVPFAGIGISLACYLGGIGMAWAQPPIAADRPAAAATPLQPGRS